MVYNKAIYEGFVGDSTVKTVSPLQFAIEATKMDQNMFSALIEMDIAEAASKNGIISLSEAHISAMYEAAGEGIGAKIKEIVDKFVSAIRNAFSKVFTFISNLVSNDKKIYEKYGKVISETSDFSKCPVKGKIWIQADFDQISKTAGSLLQTSSEIIHSDSNEDAKSKVEALEKSYEDLNSRKYFTDENSDEPVCKRMNPKGMLKDLMVGYKDTVALLKGVQSKNEAIIKNAQNVVAIARNMASEDSKVDELNRRYEILSKTLAVSSKITSLYISVYSKLIANERSLFVKIGKWALENKNGAVKANGESAVYDEMFDMLLDITNEQYCDSVWEIA